MIEMDLMTLVSIIKSPARPSGRSGELPLDQLVRDARFDHTIRERILAHFPDMFDQVEGADEWHSLQVLASQLQLIDAKAAEQLVRKLDSEEITGEAGLWAAYTAVYLGGTLRAATLQSLQAAMRVLPVQWFELMLETQAVPTISQLLLDLVGSTQINAQQALGLVRLYKRWAIANRVRWNVTLSQFLEILPDEIEKTVSAKIGRSLGPSFELPSADPFVDQLKAQSASSLFNSEAILSALNKVAKDLDRSRELAVAA
jgi:hypothetical protein